MNKRPKPEDFKVGQEVTDEECLAALKPFLVSLIQDQRQAAFKAAEDEWVSLLEQE